MLEDNCVSTASRIVTLKTNEWSKLLKYIVCCITQTLEDGKIHVKSILPSSNVYIIQQTIYFSTLDYSFVSRVTIPEFTIF